MNINKLFASEKDRRLFLKYAIPCGRVLLRRGEIEESLLLELEDMVRTGKEIRIDITDIFKIGSRMCYIIMKRLGKSGIDSGVIRNYFWYEHKKAVEWRREAYPDLDTEECMVIPGKVISTDPIRVETPSGIKTFRKHFLNKVKNGDYVTLHYDFIVEKIGKGDFDRLWE